MFLVVVNSTSHSALNDSCRGLGVFKQPSSLEDLQRGSLLDALPSWTMYSQVRLPHVPCLALSHGHLLRCTATENLNADLSQGKCWFLGAVGHRQMMFSLICFQLRLSGT